MAELVVPLLRSLDTDSVVIKTNTSSKVEALQPNMASKVKRHDMKPWKIWPSRQNTIQNMAIPCNRLDSKDLEPQTRFWLFNHSLWSPSLVVVGHHVYAGCNVTCKR